MKSGEIDRRDVIKGIALGSAAVLPVASIVAPLGAAASYAPRFFSPDELELVAMVGELILPQTDTPGARAAKAHEHIDLVLSEETRDVQHDFRDGLVWLERRSRELYGDGFLKLGPDKQTALLTRISSGEAKRPEDEPGREFFLELRKRVVFAYYTSEIGLRQEMTYKGKQAHEHWNGCLHPGKHGDSDE